MKFSAEHILISVAGSLVTRVIPSLQWVSFVIKGNQIQIYASYSEVLDEFRRELIELTATEVQADYFDESVDLDVWENALNPLGHLAYARYDKRSLTTEPMLTQRDLSGEIERWHIIHLISSALVGRVVPSLRWVGLNMTPNIKMTAQYEGSVESLEKELMETVVGRVQKMLPPSVSFTYDIAGDAQRQLPQPEQFLYARFEGTPGKAT